MAIPYKSPLKIFPATARLLQFYWPTVFGRANLAQHVVCRLSACNVLCCGLYDRQTADVCTYQGVFGDGRFNGTMQNVVGPTLVAMATKFGLKSPITRLVWQTDRRCLHLPGDFRGLNPSAKSMRHSFCIDRVLGQYGRPSQQQLGFLSKVESILLT